MLILRKFCPPILLLSFILNLKNLNSWTSGSCLLFKTAIGHTCYCWNIILTAIVGVPRLTITNKCSTMIGLYCRLKDFIMYFLPNDTVHGFCCDTATFCPSLFSVVLYVFFFSDLSPSCVNWNLLRLLPHSKTLFQ